MSIFYKDKEKIMILDLPPQIEQQIVHTAKRRGITAESLITQLVQQDADKPSYAKGDFNFDLERMKQAVEAPTVAVPHFDTPEELMAWLDNLTEADFKERV